MTRRTPQQIAVALDRGLSRRVLRGLATVAKRLVRQDGASRLPHAAAWRLRDFAYGRPSRIADYSSKRSAADAPHILLVSHDLTASGAPKVLFEIASILLEDGFAVTVLSAGDGPFCARLVEAGATVLIDPDLLMPASPTVAAILPAVDLILCNTIVTGSVVRAVADRVPTIWYLHETQSISDYFEADPERVSALSAPTVWAVSETTASFVRPWRHDIEIRGFGLPPMTCVLPIPSQRLNRDHVIVSVLGSYEPRKGQDLAAEAVLMMPQALSRALKLRCYGRPIDPIFRDALLERAAGCDAIEILGELDAAGVQSVMDASDGVLVPSRDDAVSIVAADALSSGRVVMCTETTGISAHLTEGQDGFVCPATVIGLADMLERAVARRREWGEIGARGSDVFAAHFSQERFADTVLGAVRGLLAGR